MTRMVIGGDNRSTDFIRVIRTAIVQFLRRLTKFVALALFCSKDFNHRGTEATEKKSGMHFVVPSSLCLCVSVVQIFFFFAWWRLSHAP